MGVLWHASSDVVTILQISNDVDESLSAIDYIFRAEIRVLEEDRRHDDISPIFSPMTNGRCEQSILVRLALPMMTTEYNLLWT